LGRSHNGMDTNSFRKKKSDPRVQHNNQWGYCRDGTARGCAQIERRQKRAPSRDGRAEARVKTVSPRRKTKNKKEIRKKRRKFYWGEEMVQRCGKGV